MKTAGERREPIYLAGPRGFWYDANTECAMFEILERLEQMPDMRIVKVNAPAYPAAPFFGIPVFASREFSILLAFDDDMGAVDGLHALVTGHISSLVWDSGQTRHMEALLNNRRRSDFEAHYASLKIETFPDDLANTPRSLRPFLLAREAQCSDEMEAVMSVSMANGHMLARCVDPDDGGDGGTLAFYAAGAVGAEIGTARCRRIERLAAARADVWQKNPSLPPNGSAG